MDNHPSNVRIWDAWVRLFHWSLVLSVAFMLISGETGWQFYDWHRQTGELVLALLLFRLLWGFFGSSNARLFALIRKPSHAIEHLKLLWQRRLPAERGHNAAGGWAILLMLLLLTTQAVTGLFIADEDEYIEGALYGSVPDALTDIAYRIHRTNATLLQILIAVHVVMVFFYLLYARRDLIRPMITGRMHWHEGEGVPDVHFQRFGVGLVICIIAAVLVAWLTGWFD